MTMYKLYASTTISTVTEVEADSLEDAISEQYQEGWPGIMFLNHDYPDVGEWEIDEKAANEDYPNG